MCWWGVHGNSVYPPLSFGMNIKLLEVRDIVQETGIKTIPMEKKCKTAKWLSEEAVQGTLKSLLQHHSSKASILQC